MDENPISEQESDRSQDGIIGKVNSNEIAQALAYGILWGGLVGVDLFITLFAVPFFGSGVSILQLSSAVIGAVVVAIFPAVLMVAKVDLNNKKTNTALFIGNLVVVVALLVAEIVVGRTGAAHMSTWNLVANQQTRVEFGTITAWINAAASVLSLALLAQHSRKAKFFGVIFIIFTLAYAFLSILGQGLSSIT